jgi:hypothetical protein
MVRGKFASQVTNRVMDDTRSQLQEAVQVSAAVRLPTDLELVAQMRGICVPVATYSFERYEEPVRTMTFRAGHVSPCDLHTSPSTADRHVKSRFRRDGANINPMKEKIP